MSLPVSADNVQSVAAKLFGIVQVPGALPLVGAAAVLVSVAVVASITPAARAARVDVVQALRSEWGKDWSNVLNTARIAGVFYLITFVAGTIALVMSGKVAAIAGPIAAASYVVVTVLFYQLFKSVHKRLSLLAAGVSLSATVAPPLIGGNPLVFFGVYCLLISYLMFQSTAPRILAGLMTFAGFGWLTFALPPLAHALSPYNYGPGIVGEGALTLWLLLFGVTPRPSPRHA